MESNLAVSVKIPQCMFDAIISLQEFLPDIFTKQMTVLHKHMESQVEKRVCKVNVYDKGLSSQL